MNVAFAVKPVTKPHRCQYDLDLVKRHRADWVVDVLSPSIEFEQVYTCSEHLGEILDFNLSEGQDVFALPAERE